MIKKCSICGNKNFKFTKVLSVDLINDWKLNAEEVEYINYQQGFHCDNCEATLRSMTLAKQMMNYFESNENFNIFVKKFDKKILEINQAGHLWLYLKDSKNHTLKEYPDIDIENINFPDESFDVIIHSDTMEHIPNTIRAFEECKRVLIQGGVMFFTIPIVHGRLSLKRHGMPNSFHGNYNDKFDDLVVFTEYGADFYLELIKAGFSDIRLFTLINESSVSIAAIKTNKG